MSNVIDEVVDRYEPSPEILSVMQASRPATLLALDVGSSGVRAALFDDAGNEIAGRAVRIDSASSSFTDSGVIDADVLMEQVAGAIDLLLVDFYSPEAGIELIAVSCFWHSLMGVDADGRPTTPVFGWSDKRAVDTARQLKAELNEAEIHSRTGCRFHSSYWPAKLRRLRDESPESFGATRRWLSFSDYLAEQLVGETGTSVSMASGTGLLNVRTCEWDKELAAALHIKLETLPEIFAPGRTFSRLASRYSNRWPQLRDAGMFPAIADGAANNIGAGCSSRDKAALMIGTSGAMRVLFEGTVPATIPPELWCYRADRERVVIGGALSDGGSLFKWVSETFLAGEDPEWIDGELHRLEPESHGLTILPFWNGERSTGWNGDARGAILGLSSQTRPIEILRAAMEAVAYRFALIARALEPLAPAAKVFASGYALHTSRVWPQILADVLGRPLQVSPRAEASTRGAALLALEAAGKISSIEDFTVPVEAVIEPDMVRHVRYQAGLERQQRFYDAMIAETS
jgi:gluconokinase